MKQKRKGFTLVELIVVIAIIGILAAVLIPTFSGAIESARYANDQAAARNMSTIVKQYCMMNGVDEEDLQAPDIRYIINTEEEFYTFRPASSEGVFWYNRNTGNVEVTKGVVPSGAALAAEGDFTGNSIEEVLPGQIYLNTEGELANFLNDLRSVSSGAEYSALKNKASDVEGIDLTSIVTAYDPATTLFVGQGNSFTEAILSTTAEISKVVFADGIQILSGSMSIPLKTAEGLSVQIPVTVKVVEQQNPLNDLGGARITTTASSQAVTVVEGAFSNVEVSGQLSKTVDMKTYNARVAQGNALIRVMPKAKPTETEDKTDYDETNGWYTLTEDRANKYATSGIQARLSVGLLENLVAEAEGATGNIVSDVNRIQQIVTKDLMAAFPTIHTLNITYQPTSSKDGKAATMDVHVIAIDNTGKVVDLIIVAAV